MIAGFASRNRAWTVVAASLVLGLGLVALTDAAQQPPGPAGEPPKAGDAAPEKPVEGEAPKGAPARASIPAEGAEAKDYVVGPNDLVQLTVYDLDGPGLQTIKTIRVSATGGISVPFVNDAVRVAGLSEVEAQRAVVEAYKRAGLLDNANVSFAVTEARNRPPEKPEIKPDELVTVSVMDLAGPGVETVKTSRVDGEGNISLPFVGKVKAAGLDSAGLEQAVAKAYGDKKLIQNAMVAVSLPGRGESHQLSNKARPAAAAGGEMGMEGMPEGAMPAAAADPFAGVAAGPVDPALAALLDRKLPEVKFDGVPLSDVVDFLRDVTTANIFVDWRALEAAGIERNAPVTAGLRDVALKDALAIILRGVDHSLNYATRNNVIQIGMAIDRRAADLKVAAYDVADLLETAADRKAGGAALAAVISQTVRPDFWRGAHANGQGTVSAFGNKVIVTATPEVHQEVEALLTVLRQPGARQPATKPSADAGDGTKVEDMAPEDIAEVDRQMADHMKLRQDLEVEIQKLKLQGARDNTPSVKTATDLLKIRNQLIEDRAAWFRQKYKGYRFTPDGGRLGGPAADEQAAVEALWREKYAPHVVNINGQTNEGQLREEFYAELGRRDAERKVAQ